MDCQLMPQGTWYMTLLHLQYASVVQGHWQKSSIGLYHFRNILFFCIFLFFLKCYSITRWTFAIKNGKGDEKGREGMRKVDETTNCSSLGSCLLENGEGQINKQVRLATDFLFSPLRCLAPPVHQRGTVRPSCHPTHTLPSVARWRKQWRTGGQCPCPVVQLGPC